MAGKKENIKALFSNSRSRVIILFTVLLLVVTVVIGVVKFGASSSDHTAVANLESGGGGVNATPGSMNQTAQYAALQATQNIEQAKQASQTGTSAIPTIIRTHAFGEGVQMISQKEGGAGADFSALNYDTTGEAQKLAWQDVLKHGDCSKDSIDKVIAQGAVVNDLRESCSCEQLKNAGYKANQLESLCTCADLKSAGFDLEQLKEAGFTAARLRLCGYTACQERGAGFTAQEMKDGGFSDGELKGAGFSERDIARAGGLPDGLTIEDVQKAGCDPRALERLRAAGVTAPAIRRTSGCGVDKLKAAGFIAQDLKNAGFSAADLKNAGYSPAELKAAGYSAQDLLSAGFTGDDLNNAGFTAAEIQAAEMVLPSGVSGLDVKKAGCSVEAIKRQRLAGVSAALIHKYAGCTAQALNQAGFDKSDLLNAGFKPAEIAALSSFVADATIRTAGCDPDKLKLLKSQGVTAGRIHSLNGCSPGILKQAGFDAKSLLDAGFAPEDLLKAGFTAPELSAAESAAGAVSKAAIIAAGCDPDKLKVLKAQGVTAGRIHGLNGCSVDILKQVGFDAKSLLDAGFAPEDLLKAGFTAAELNAAESEAGALSQAAIIAAGCDPDKLKALKAQGVTAGRIHGLNGCSVDILKQAGFDAKSLLDAGFATEDLIKAGFTALDLNAAESDSAVSKAAINAAACDPDKLKELKAQGATAGRIHSLNGCGADILRQVGFDAKALADAGFTPAELLAAGFTAEQLIQAGLSPTGIIAAGRTADCSVSSLTAAHQLKVSAALIKQTLGCGANALNKAGFSAVDLKNAGFTAAELKNAGFGLGDLKNAGYSAKELAAAGWTAKEMKNAGFSPQQLKDAGFSAQQLKDIGFTAEMLKAAGFSATVLKAAGFNADALHKAGFSATDMKASGFSAEQLKKAGYTNQELRDAGFTSLAGLEAVSPLPAVPSSVLNVPEFVAPAPDSAGAIAAANAKRIDDIRSQQEKQAAVQRYQQKIEQRGGAMMAAANQAMQQWRVVPQQSHAEGSVKDEEKRQKGQNASNEMQLRSGPATITASGNNSRGSVVIKTGDILFAVIDTSVNSDEPGPILATIVSGKLQGSKLIGSFNLPPTADKMVVTFNTLSILGADNTVGITAFAIDPNTARTALSSQTDHHYLSRYGSLFASTFLEGFGNAFQSANTTISIAGTGGTTDTTVQSGIGRSTLDNAVIGLATLGRAWGQVAAQNMNRPTTVQLYAGTGVGILFTQTLKLT